MATLPIAKIGNPVLRKIAEPVDPAIIPTRAYQQFIDDMFETMDAHEGFGLAAPQVARSDQLIVMRCEGPGCVSRDGPDQSQDRVLWPCSGRNVGRLFKRGWVARESDAAVFHSGPGAGPGGVFRRFRGVGSVRRVYPT